MVFMSVLIAIVVYIVIAVVFVYFVRRRTNKKIYLLLAIAFVILLPTWDVVLGYPVYYLSCMLVQKTEIYETAETEGIYYEGDLNGFLIDLSDISPPDRKLVRFADVDFRKGYKYLEALVTEQGDTLQSKRINPTVYRCNPIPHDPKKPDQHQFECMPTRTVQSEYMVHSTVWKIGVTEIRNVRIVNKRNSKVMAIHNEVVRWHCVVPLFVWLNLGGGSSPGVSCPEKSRYYDFHYEVLRPKH